MSFSTGIHFRKVENVRFFGSWFYQIAKKNLANKNNTSPIKSRPCKQSRLRKYIPTSTTCSLVTHSAAMASICPQGFVETGRTPRVKSNLSKLSFQTSSTSSISFMYIYIYCMHYILYHLFRLFCLFQVQDWQKTKPLNLIQSWDMAGKQHACSCADLIAVTSSWTFLKRLGRKCLSQNHRARSLSRTSTQRLLCFCLEIDVHWLSLI